MCLLASGHSEWSGPYYTLGKCASLWSHLSFLLSVLSWSLKASIITETLVLLFSLVETSWPLTSTTSSDLWRHRYCEHYNNFCGLKSILIILQLRLWCLFGKLGLMWTWLSFKKRPLQSTSTAHWMAEQERGRTFSSLRFFYRMYLVCRCAVKNYIHRMCVQSVFVTPSSQFPHSGVLLPSA